MTEGQAEAGQLELPCTAKLGSARQVTSSHHWDEAEVEWLALCIQTEPSSGKLKR